MRSTARAFKIEICRAIKQSVPPLFVTTTIFLENWKNGVWSSAMQERDAKDVFEMCNEVLISDLRRQRIRWVGTCHNWKAWRRERRREKIMNQKQMRTRIFNTMRTEFSISGKFSFEHKGQLIECRIMSELYTELKKRGKTADGSAQKFALKKRSCCGAGFLHFTRFMEKIRICRPFTHVWIIWTSPPQ